MNYSLSHFEAEISMEDYLQDYVNVEEFLECCKQCPQYGTLWSCPPYDFNPLDIWKEYRSMLVYGYRIQYEGERTYEDMRDVLYEQKKRITEELYALEQEIPESRSLSAGECQLCQECTKPLGKPCCHPDTMRYSIESLGGDVGRTISRLCGIEIEWVEEGKLPNHFVLVGALLKK